MGVSFGCQNDAELAWLFGWQEVGLPNVLQTGQIHSRRGDCPALDARNAPGGISGVGMKEVGGSGDIPPGWRESRRLPEGGVFVLSLEGWVKKYRLDGRRRGKSQDRKTWQRKRSAGSLRASAWIQDGQGGGEAPLLGGSDGLGGVGQT